MLAVTGNDSLSADWDEPDPGLLAELTRTGALGAEGDLARRGMAIALPVEHDRAMIRAALRCLLANRMITITPRESWPEWQLLDPPDSWPSPEEKHGPVRDHLHGGGGRA